MVKETAKKTKESDSPVRGLWREQEGSTLEKLFKEQPVIQVSGELGNQVTQICINSRKVIPGSLFFAISGELTNGNYFIEEAIDRGACAIVTEESPPQHCIIPHIQVDNVRESLANISRRFHKDPDLQIKLTGVTGTNGKTTVTSLVKFILDERGHSSGTAVLGTLHYDLGKRVIPSTRTTPEAHDICSMLKLAHDEGCKRAMMEVSSHGVCQKRIHGLHFETAVFLNLTPEHLDFHGSMESYYKAKRSFVVGEHAPEPKHVVVNLDDGYGKRLFHEIPEGITKYGFGEDKEAHFRARHINLGANHTDLQLEYPDGIIELKTPLIGRFNVQNILASLAVGWIEGRDMHSLAARLEMFTGSPGRMECVKEGQDFNVFVDYAHTSDALRNILSVLREVTDGRLLLVFGCGGDRDQNKRPEMTHAAQEYCDFVWATADNPRSEPLDSIFGHMKAGVQSPGRISFVKDRRRAIGLAIDQAQPSDCLVIAGKGHEAYQEFQNVVVPFDDRRVARELLQLQKASGKEVLNA